MDCENCGGCEGCGGCGRVLELTERELAVLEALAQFAFLPVARRPEGALPHCPDCGDPEAILHLEKKGLIDLDYSAPLACCDYRGCEDLKIRGSMGLTARGQGVLETLRIQGPL